MSHYWHEDHGRAAHFAGWDKRLDAYLDDVAALDRLDPWAAHAREVAEHRHHHRHNVLGALHDALEQAAMVVAATLNTLRKEEP